jgi:hypothetical protein
VVKGVSDEDMADAVHIMKSSRRELISLPACHVLVWMLVIRDAWPTYLGLVPWSWWPCPRKDRSASAIRVSSA